MTVNAQTKAGQKYTFYHISVLWQKHIRTFHWYWILLNIKKKGSFLIIFVCDLKEELNSFILCFCFISVAYVSKVPFKNTQMDRITHLDFVNFKKTKIYIFLF